MFLIPCPYCGERSQAEFICGGEAAIIRPGPPDVVPDEVWRDYLFARANPKGWRYERWRHVHGCGAWFTLLRHTVTHEIRGPFGILDPAPEAAE